MFEKILFPTDFSAHAQAELDCLSGFPHVREIHLLHVVKAFPIPVIERLAAEVTREYLEEAKRYLESLDPAVTVTLDVTAARDIAGAILDAAGAAGADLIVISGYATSFRAGILLGRVPATVLCRISRTNVLVMPNRLIDSLQGKTYTKFCRNIFAKVLCPTDFSEFSEKAIACAGAAGGVREILLLHVVPEDTAQDTTPYAKARLHRIREALPHRKVKVRTIVTGGDPAPGIARVAGEEDASLIWLSVEGKGCLHEFLAGSIVQDVVTTGKRPVLVIRSVE
ncbi:MAG: universal stress protein [Methanoregula sp.]|jgi:nucleotide-binding universal stress UspA family protein|uniref:universal stress protein n=1 Tax=Methanoregula sp. TaxID=2052170 RepID=UPI003D0984CD